QSRTRRHIRRRSACELTLMLFSRRRWPYTFGSNMTDREINRLFSDHFSHLDRLVTVRLPNRDWRHRGPIVMGLPENERNLYFVHDVVAITCNAGMGAWIHYHIDDEGWIDDAGESL
ncbi:hypothetical protein, partial [Luteolibacter pohnpeiensis]